MIAVASRSSGGSSSISATSVLAIYCADDPNCEFVENSCELKCDLLDYAGCTQANVNTNRNGDLCMWDAAAQACRKSCAFEFGRDREACNTKLPSLCTWSDGLGRCTAICASGAVGGASPQDSTLAASARSTCRWIQREHGSVRFSAAAGASWVAADPAEPAALPLSEELRQQLARAVGGTGLLPLSVPLEQQASEPSCDGTMRVTVGVPTDGSATYDDAVLLAGSVRRLDAAQREAAGERAGIVNPGIAGAGGVDRSMLVAVMLAAVAAVLF
jgi:hypothetical protein